MKTKHILTALALPAMFAACTAEDIVSENNGLQQDQRAKLSKDFVLNTSNEVDSRYAVEGTTALNFIFEEGDLIGANVIDAFDKRYADDAVDEDGNSLKFDKNDPSTWKILNTVTPSLPFENIGGTQWKSAGELGIGNYLFTNPYNPEDKNRAAAKFELPIVVQYDAENPNAHIEDYNKAVAAAILYEGQTEANISLKNLYTYPKVRIRLDKNEGAKKITKVILEKTGGFIYRGGFDHTTVADMFNAKNIERAIKKELAKSEEDYWAQKQTSDFVYEQNYDYAEMKTTPYFIYEMDQALVDGSNCKEAEVRLMLPSVKDFVNSGIVMYVCTDNLTYKVNFNAYEGGDNTREDVTGLEFGQNTTSKAKKNALWRNKSNTLKTEILNKNYAKDINLGNIVTTAEDWNKLVALYGDEEKYATVANGGEGGLTVSILDEQFALTSELDMPEVAQFIIGTNINVEGEVTLKNVKVNQAVTVKDGAVLTTTPSFEAWDVYVENGGELVFAAEYDKKEKLVDYDGITYVYNSGIVTVPAGVKAKFNLPAMFTGTKNVKTACEGVLNIGAAEARSTAKAEATLSGYNYGEINNYGVVTVAKGAILYNIDASSTYGYVQDKKTGKYDDEPNVNNEGEFNVEGTFNNQSIFVNNGTLTSNFNDQSTIDNTSGVLEVGENAVTYIDDNTNGEIILAKLNPTNFTIHDAKGSANYSSTVAGTIKFTATTAKVDLSTSPVTYLIANGDIEIEKTFLNTKDDADATNDARMALDVLEVNGGDIKVTATTKAADGTTDVKTALVTKLLVNSGKATISSKINSVETVEIAAGASLQIVKGSGELIVARLVETGTGADKKEASITYGDADSEEDLEAGKLYVDGKLHLSGVKESDEKYSLPATLENNVILGKDVEISCAKTDSWTAPEGAAEALTKAQKAYNKALVAAIKKWAQDNTNGGIFVGAIDYDLNKLSADGKTNVAKATFTNYHPEAKKYEFYKTTGEALDAAYDAYCEAYKATVEDGKLPTTWKGVADNYSTAVTTLLADEKAKAQKAATWAVTDGAARIYDETEYPVENADFIEDADEWTPAQKALYDFVQAVKGTTTGLTVSGYDATLYKCIALTSAALSTPENLAPACSQVMTSDVIYKIFGKTAIGYTKNWITYGDLDNMYNSLEKTWDLALVKSWINEVAMKAEGTNDYVDKAKDFISDNNVLDVFQDWTYDAKIIVELAKLLPVGEATPMETTAVVLPSFGE